MTELEKKALNGVFGDKDFNSVLDSGLEYLNSLVSGKKAVAASGRRARHPPHRRVVFAEL